MPAASTGVAWYPGLIDGGAPDIVHGELHRLREPASALVWLDEFEGVTRGASSVTDPDDYVRAERRIQTSTGTVIAWVYLYRRDVSGLARVEDGRWFPHGGRS